MSVQFHLYLSCKHCEQPMTGIVSYHSREVCRDCGGEAIAAKDYVDWHKQIEEQNRVLYSELPGALKLSNMGKR